MFTKQGLEFFSSYIITDQSCRIFFNTAWSAGRWCAAAGHHLPPRIGPGPPRNRLLRITQNTTEGERWSQVWSSGRAEFKGNVVLNNLEKLWLDICWKPAGFVISKYFSQLLWNICILALCLRISYFHDILRLILSVVCCHRAPVPPRTTHNYKPYIAETAVRSAGPAGR